MARIILYHGTDRAFEQFSEDFAIRGSEPNSALGVHLTECPANAAHYARLAAGPGRSDDARVLIVELDVSKVALVGSAADYLGREPEYPDLFDLSVNRTRSDFVERRLELQALGFDAVATSETELSDVDCCWAVFDPTKLKIVGLLSPDEAEEIETEFHFDEIEFVEVQLFSDEPTAEMVVGI